MINCILILYGFFLLSKTLTMDSMWFLAIGNSKKYAGNVFRGQTLDESFVLQKYVNPYNEAKALGGPALVEEKVLLSCTKDNGVADFFVQLSKNKIKNGEAGVSVKFNIKSKRGVDIDDISDYGKIYVQEIRSVSKYNKRFCWKMERLK